MTLEIFKVACYIYMASFGVIMLIWAIGIALKRMFPNWYSRNISQDFETTNYPPECFNCNLDNRHCFKELDCDIVKFHMDEVEKGSY